MPATWRWAMGNGRDGEGRPVGFNLVQGFNEGPGIDEQPIPGECANSETVVLVPPDRVADSLVDRPQPGGEVALHPPRRDDLVPVRVEHGDRPAR